MEMNLKTEETKPISILSGSGNPGINIPHASQAYWRKLMNSLEKEP
jgi:hypothetical protein